MPAAINYIRADDPVRWKEYDSEPERRERLELWERSQRYYDGEHFKPLVVTADDPIDDNVVINVTKQAVDRTLSFVFPDLPRMVMDADEKVSPEEEYLSACFRYNGGVTLMSSMAFVGALAGHVYVKIMKPDPSIEEGGIYPQILILHPTSIVTYWQADNMRNVVWHEQRFNAGKVEYLQDTVYDRDGRRWETYLYERTAGSSVWTLVDGYPQRWDNQLGPIVQWQHLPEINGFYGRPESTKDQIALNDAINRTASDISRILRYHASPRTIGTGLEASEVQETAINGFFTVANKDADIFNLEMKSDLSASMGFFDTLMASHLQQARVVIMKGSVKDFQRVTNTAIRAVFLDMIAKNQVLRWQYGEGLQKMAQRLLWLGGFDSTRRPDLIWSDPLPSDDTEAINTLAIERNLKIVSHETAAKKRNYDWESEKQRMENESDLEFLQEPKTDGSAPIKSDKNEVER